MAELRLITVAALVAIAGLGGCSNDCVNTQLSRIEAPDGRHVAIMFERSCGATTGFSTQVSILASGEDPSGGGNVFSADGDHGAAAAGDWGGPWADIDWLGPDRLLIRYAAGSRIFEQRNEVDGVTIAYRQMER